MLQTDLRRDDIQTHLSSVERVELQTVKQKWEEMEKDMMNTFISEGMDMENLLFTRYLDMRYKGQEHSVKVPVPNGIWTKETLSTIENNFHNLHEKTYTFKLTETPTEIVNFHLTGIGQVQKHKQPEIKKLNHDDALLEERSVYFEEDGWLITSIYEREKMGRGMEVYGPAIIEEKQTSTILYPNQRLEVDKYGNLVIEMGNLNHV